MKKNAINLILLIIFTILLACGVSFMQYHMLNAIVNLVLTVIGMIGTVIFSIRLLKEESK